MPRGRSDLTVFFSARMTPALEEAVTVYGEAFDVSFSEAIRQLIVAGLEAKGYTRTDESGEVVVDDEWKTPPPATNEESNG